MEHLTPGLSLDLHSSQSFDAFSAFDISQKINISHSKTAQASLAKHFLRKFSDKIGRNFSDLNSDGGSDIDENALNLIKNHVLLNGSVADVNSELFNEDWARQADYDKFMNEIWIGVVLTLIVISMAFCICSCFLYHQFRHWKNNYHRNIQRNIDEESVKFSIEEDDLPSYTLVSGLPTYDAALQQFKKTLRNSYLITHPSIFKIFESNEKLNSNQQLPLQYFVNEPTSCPSQIRAHTNDSSVVTLLSRCDPCLSSHNIKNVDNHIYQEGLVSNNNSNNKVS